MPLFILFKYDIKYFISEFANWLHLFLKNREFVTLNPISSAEINFYNELYLRHWFGMSIEN